MTKHPSRNNTLIKVLAVVAGAVVGVLGGAMTAEWFWYWAIVGM